MKLNILGVRDGRLHHLIGISPQAFMRLAAAVWVQRPDAGTGRPHKLPFVTRLFLVSLHLRTNLTERQLAEFFGMSDSATHDLIAKYETAIGALLSTRPLDRRFLYIVDGTMIPAHDRSRTAKSKNYRRSVSTQVVIRRNDREIVAVTRAEPGSRHDARAWRESGIAENFTSVNLIGDGGYRGCSNVLSPARGPDQKIVRDSSYRRFRRKRATAEHALAQLKCFQIMRQIRRKGTSIDTVITAAAVLHNLARNEDYALAT